LEQFVNRARALYSLPAVALRVLELTSHPKVDVRALKECLENDPALTTKILRVVNSALFGLSREVTDLNQALALLGTKPLKMLVLGFSLPRNLFAALEADVLSRYWRHTLTKAVVGRELAQRYWHTPGDEAFIAGLLQEIGELVLVQDLGEPYVKFVHRVYQDGGDLLEMELATLGFDHAVLSARLLDSWGLPESIVQAVGMPHEANAILALPAAQQSLPQILHIAELIARLLTSERAPSLEDLLAACGQYRRLSIEDLPELLANLDEKVEQLAAVLKLQLTDGADYSTVLSAAHEQLSVVAHDAALELLQPQSDWQETAELAQALSDFARTTENSPKDTTPAPLTHAPLAASRARNLDGDSSGASARRESHATAVTSTLVDAGLEARVLTAMGSCRRQRQALSLMLVQLDHFDTWVITQGVHGAKSLVEHLGGVLTRALDLAGTCEHLGDGLFAIVLEDHDRQATVAVARELQRQVGDWSRPMAAATGEPLTLSQGLASLSAVPKNFPPSELIESTRRCLAGAQLSGGDSVKSIDL
jgi:HD-like signal output (HDOD) protein/GGDEF domain-containing protein